MKLLIAFILSFASMTAAVAEQPTWYYINKTDSGTVIHARTSDLMVGRSDQQAAKVWVKLDHSDDKTTPLRQTMVLYTVNCVAQTYRRVSATFYKADGSTETDTSNEATQHIIPESNISNVTDELCADPSSDSERASLPTT